MSSNEVNAVQDNRYQVFCQQSLEILDLIENDYHPENKKLLLKAMDNLFDHVKKHGLPAEQFFSNNDILQTLLESDYCQEDIIEHFLKNAQEYYGTESLKASLNDNLTYRIPLVLVFTGNFNTSIHTKIAIFKLLLRYGAKLNPKNWKFDSPFKTAYSYINKISSGKDALISYLCELVLGHFNQINANELQHFCKTYQKKFNKIQLQTLFNEALKKDTLYKDLLSVLLTQNELSIAEENLQNLSNNLDMMKLMLQHKQWERLYALFKTGLVKPEFAKTCFLALLSEKTLHLDLLITLLKTYKIDPNGSIDTSNNQNLLFKAAIDNHIELFYLLIEAGINYHVVDTTNTSILHILIKKCAKNESFIQDYMQFFNNSVKEDTLNIIDREKLTPLQLLYSNKFKHLTQKVPFSSWAEKFSNLIKEQNIILTEKQPEKVTQPLKEKKKSDTEQTKAPKKTIKKPEALIKNNPKKVDIKPSKTKTNPTKTSQKIEKNPTKNQPPKKQSVHVVSAPSPQPKQTKKKSTPSKKKTIVPIKNTVPLKNEGLNHKDKELEEIIQPIQENNHPVEMQAPESQPISQTTLSDDNAPMAEPYQQRPSSDHTHPHVPMDTYQPLNPYASIPFHPHISQNAFIPMLMPFNHAMTPFYGSMNPYPQIPLLNPIQDPIWIRNQLIIDLQTFDSIHPEAEQSKKRILLAFQQLNPEHRYDNNKSNILWHACQNPRISLDLITFLCHQDESVILFKNSEWYSCWGIAMRSKCSDSVCTFLAIETLKYLDNHLIQHPEMLKSLNIDEFPVELTYQKNTLSHILCSSLLKLSIINLSFSLERIEQLFQAQKISDTHNAFNKTPYHYLGETLQKIAEEITEEFKQPILMPYFLSIKNMLISTLLEKIKHFDANNRIPSFSEDSIKNLFQLIAQNLRYDAQGYNILWHALNNKNISKSLIAFFIEQGEKIVLIVNSNVMHHYEWQICWNHAIKNQSNSEITHLLAQETLDFFETMLFHYDSHNKTLEIQTLISSILIDRFPPNLKSKGGHSLSDLMNASHSIQQLNPNNHLTQTSLSQKEIEPTHPINPVEHHIIENNNIINAEQEIHPTHSTQQLSKNNTTTETSLPPKEIEPIHPINQMENEIIENNNIINVEQEIHPTHSTQQLSKNNAITETSLPQKKIEPMHAINRVKNNNMPDEEQEFISIIKNWIHNNSSWSMDHLDTSQINLLKYDELFQQAPSYEEQKDRYFSTYMNLAIIEAQALILDKVHTNVWNRVKVAATLKNQSLYVNNLSEQIPFLYGYYEDHCSCYLLIKDNKNNIIFSTGKIHYHHRKKEKILKIDTVLNENQDELDLIFLDMLFIRKHLYELCKNNESNALVDQLIKRQLPFWPKIGHAPYPLPQDTIKNNNKGLSWSDIDENEAQEKKRNQKIPKELKKDLNSNQYTIVKSFSDASQGIYCLEGPPGTGKTKTISAIAEILLEKNTQIIISAPTNKAVQTLIYRCQEKMPQASMCFIGVHDKLPNDLSPVKIINQALTTDIQWIKTYQKIWNRCKGQKTYIRKKNVENCLKIINNIKNFIKDKMTNIDNDMIKEFNKISDSCLNYLNTYKNQFNPKETQKILNTDEKKKLKNLSNELNSLSNILKDKIHILIQENRIHNSHIIFCTVATLIGNRHAHLLKNKVLIIDEASMAKESDILPVLLLLQPQKCLLAGDTQQLQPFALPKNIQALGYNKSLMERLIAHQQHCNKKLLTQYRTNHQITEFTFTFFYKGEVKNSKKIDNHKNAFLNHLALIDIAEGIEEQDETGSYKNTAEAHAIIDLLDLFYEKHSQIINFNTITIITFYSGQVSLLNELIKNKLYAKSIKVLTTDSVQGDENDIILLSCVRANDQNKVGFLDNNNRVNVALTRPKHNLLVFGHVNTLKNSISQSFNALIEHAEKKKYLFNSFNAFIDSIHISDKNKINNKII